MSKKQRWLYSLLTAGIIVSIIIIFLCVMTSHRLIDSVLKIIKEVHKYE